MGRDHDGPIGGEQCVRGEQLGQDPTSVVGVEMFGGLVEQHDREGRRTALPSSNRLR
jgi:hypothetical protein